MTLAFDLYRAQGGRCALSGLRQVGSGKVLRPFAPSLDRIDSTGGYTRDNVRLVCQAVNFALNAYGEDVFREIATATAGFEPTLVAASDQERRRKTAYIQHVVDQAPQLLAAHDGVLAKQRMRECLRGSFAGRLPIDEANAYGWGFRHLTEAGVIEPASGSTHYRLRSQWCAEQEIKNGEGDPPRTWGDRSRAATLACADPSRHRPPGAVVPVRGE